MTRCAACRRELDPARSTFVLERGGRTAASHRPADLACCSIECVAAMTDQEPRQ